MKSADFSERLKYALIYNDMRAKDLCDRTGTPQSAMSAYLAGEYAPRSSRAYAIAKALDVSEAWLLGYAVEMARTDDQKKTDAQAAVVKRISEEKGFRDLIIDIASLNQEHLDLVRNLVSALSRE